ncbi:hypothetical protein FQA39_LY16182 [Lamprigera yunnana]|nr:hypothetical protein FQA39_LY16182 [Lamprigera yunnana]
MNKMEENTPERLTYQEYPRISRDHIPRTIRLPGRPRKRLQDTRTTTIILEEEEGSVSDNRMCYSGRPRTGQSIDNIVAVQEDFLPSPSKSAVRYSLKADILNATVWRI